MLEDLESGRDIARLTENLLIKADARGRLPTPVDDIVAAAGLAEPTESLLSPSNLERAPLHIREAMARVRFKVRAVLDRREREVHLDPGIEHSGRRGFKKLHEVTHDILPWQRGLAFVDDDFTLSPAVRSLFEREANQGAAELYFQRDFFRRVDADYTIGMASVVELSKTFGPSIHSTLRRYAETHSAAVAALVLDSSPCSVNSPSYRYTEAYSSAAWNDRFAPPRSWRQPLTVPPFDFLLDAQEAHVTDGPVGRDMSLCDREGRTVGVQAEIFSNQYNLLVLLWLPRREWFKHRQVLVPNGR